ncbi:MAG: hypothetical protein IT257_10430 [Chitinophagaceae bacterium]|nr:hypothetical protein [Chitinophagaceae bacterium]
MATYKASSRNSRNFDLTKEEMLMGALNYAKWYSFKADIELADGSNYQLEPTGFWDYKIELKKDGHTLLNFKMGWKGIVIKTFFGAEEKVYLLKHKGLLSSNYLLLDTTEQELVQIDTDFVWSKLKFDYTLDTSPAFDAIQNNEVLLLTMLHCINYYMMVASAAV